ncbi:MAG: SusC/RagA family TonB-linked outer membrane protein [Flavobacterium sp.]|nr:MAG: SusC/RagA family TonB-linked outer membrane protein [Flavobacterium sp.]
MYSFYKEKLWAMSCPNKRLLLSMKFTIIILLISVFQVNARTYAQRITLAEKNAKLGKVFNKISLQSGYDFFISEALLNKANPVNINVKDLDLRSALDLLMNNQPFEFKIEDKSVVIIEKQVSFLDKIIFSFRAIDVSGKVIGEGGEFLAGAIVNVKGSSRSVAANDKGEFSLSRLDENAILVISYIGYENKEVKVSSGFMSIVLARKVGELEEVSISTGYQKISKDQLTGAASSLNEKQYRQREAVTGNFLESLEGKVPGLVYNGQTGELSIRGVSTFDAVKQPLIVLDGFPTEIDLRTINPNDILSISVLRDAAAASIYGVRASNGVIIVETRRGKSGKPLFNLNSSYGFQAKPDFNKLKYAPASEFVQLQRDNFYISRPSKFLYDLGIYKKDPSLEILFRGPQVGVTNPELSQAQVDLQLANLGSYDNLQEYSDIFYQQRQVRNINLDASGGNENSTYFIGFNHIGETPNSRRSENSQFNLNIANTIKLSSRINFDFRGTYTNITNTSGVIPSYGSFLPYERLRDANGNALPVTLGPGRNNLSSAVLTQDNIDNQAAGLYDLLYYPYRDLTANTNTVRTSSMRFQGRLNGRITDWLNVDIGGNYENQGVLTDNLQTEESFDLRRLVNSMALMDPANGRALFTNLPKGNILRKNSQHLVNYTVRGQLNFNKIFSENDHNFSGLLGVERRKTANDGYLTSYFGYDGQTLVVKPINMGLLNNTRNPAFPLSPIGNGVFFNSNNYFNETSLDRRFQSYYGQGTYIYKSKYVATGSFRVDQSNLFGVDPKYRNKPLWSAGLNWRIGEEEFIKKQSWVDQLQLRAATGFNGNVPSSSNGAFLILNSALNTSLHTPLAYNEVLSPENQSLRWETTQNYNFGLDYALFNNRISGSVDYYIKTSKDVFGQFDSDPTSGFNQYNANTASIENRGLEILINSSNIRRNKFEWRTQLTASFNNNKVIAVKTTDLNNSQQITSATVPVQGQPLGSIYSYNYGGLNNLGQPYVLDRNGNRKILTMIGTNIIDVTREDLIDNGTITPRHVIGFNNQLTLGAFDLSFLFMYYGGHVMRVEQPNPNNVNSTIVTLAGSSNYWRNPGDEANTRVPGYAPATASAPGYYQVTALYGYQYASEFVRKADFIRLRDVVVTYRAKAKFLQDMGLKNTQFRFQAQNPFRYTFSGNDIDPDAIDRQSGIRRLETQPFYSLTLFTNF